MKTPEIKITENASNNLDVVITLNELTTHNLSMLEIIFDEFIKAREAELVNWSDEKKAEHDYAYRMQPSIEIRTELRRAILKINPHQKFDVFISATKLKQQQS